jgi:hypothetical protein
VDRAIDAVRGTLPAGWEVARVERNVVPTGWRGDARAVLLRLEDTAMTFPHPEGFSYRAFWKLWLVPRDWEGRMEVMRIGADAPAALFLGENSDFRVLARSLGRNGWPEGAAALGRALGLETLPLGPRPAHTIDAAAMQRLYQRLDSATGGRAERWHRQVYGIAEMSDLVYVELLTWEGRDEEEPRDPTSLGELAEAETRFLARQAFAAFPGKRGLYLRRVTDRSFSDVLRVNAAALGAESGKAQGARVDLGRTP